MLMREVVCLVFGCNGEPPAGKNEFPAGGFTLFLPGEASKPWDAAS